MLARTRMTGVWMAGGLLLLVGSGCATLEEKRQLQMHNRSLQAEKDACAEELRDCRMSTGTLRTQIEALESQLAAAEQLADSYKTENDRLSRRCDELTAIVDKIAGGKDLSQPLIIERALPPALDTAIKDFAAQYPGMIEYDAKKGVVKWQSDLVFALGSVVIKDAAKESLKKFTGIINSPAANGFDVAIVGHTDNIPIKRAETLKDHPTNWHLSVHRAISVSDELQKDGLGAARIGVMGFGEYRPVADNGAESGRAKNRRVEIFVVKKENMLAAADGFDLSPAGMLAWMDRE